MNATFPLRSCFLALPLDEAAKEQFQALQSRLEPYTDCLRFQNPETPHLTLQFWKEVGELEYQGICDQVQQIAGRHAPFTLSITAAEVFSYKGKASVLYLKPAFSEVLARVKKQCPWGNDRPFAPHITLARIKHPDRFATVQKKLMKLLDTCEMTIQCDCLRLYAEVDGKKQTPLIHHPLRHPLHS